MTAATSARAKEGVTVMAPFCAVVAGAVVEAGTVDVAPGAPGSLVVVDFAITDWRTDDGKKDTVCPCGSYTPFQATV